MSQGTTETKARIATAITEFDAAAWDACANPDAARYNPFLAHAFLAALEHSRCVGARTGWSPCHIAIDDADGAIAACMPLYVKNHSQGEYVFDHGWADAYEQAGGRYYPKLQCAVPFTPVPGPRLLVRAGEDPVLRRRQLASAGVALARRIGASSLHVTFMAEDEWRDLGATGFLQRTDRQFHWQNHGYSGFGDFLATLASRKRKAIRREREQAMAGGVSIEHISGRDITQAHWDAMYAFYMDTGSRKWGRPYLNRDFFSELGRAMPDRCLLVMVRREGRFIAGALNLIGGDCLYGRYWGALEPHPALHFEVCYYQAIDYAIRHGLSRVEAGAQGEHKLARGYLPAPTYSAHWIADGGLARAVARFLEHERRAVDLDAEAMTAAGPYRKSPPPDEQD